MARIDVAVQSSIPNGVSSRRIDHYTQDADGGTFDLGDAADIAFDEDEAGIQAALDAEYTPGDYVVTGDADDFTVLYPVDVVALVLDGTDLTLTADTPTVQQEQIQGGVALDDTDGAMFVNTGDTRAVLVNTGAAAHDVTFVTPQTVRGLAVADKTYTVLPGEALNVGPFPTTQFNQRSGDNKGKVYVNADGTQSEVTVNPFTD